MSETPRLEAMPPEDPSEETPVPVIYKEEANPLLKLVLRLVGGTVVVVILLFLAGMAMGFMNIRPPTFDGQVVLNQVPGSTPQATPVSEVPESPRPRPVQGPEAQAAREAGREAGKLFKEHGENPEAFWAGFNEGGA